MRNSFLYNSLGRNISSMLRECPLGSLSYSEHASSVKNNTCLFLWVSLSPLPGFVCYRKSWCLVQFVFLSGLRVVPAIRSAGDNFNQDVWSFIGIHVKKFKPLLGLTWMTNTEIWAAYFHTNIRLTVDSCRYSVSHDSCVQQEYIGLFFAVIKPKQQAVYEQTPLPQHKIGRLHNVLVLEE